MSITTDKETLFKVSFFGMSSKVEVWVQLDADAVPEDIVDAAISEATNDDISITLSSFDDIKIADCDDPASEYDYNPEDE